MPLIRAGEAGPIADLLDLRLRGQRQRVTAVDATVRIAVCG
ncbi:hypothetical protein [Sphingomonas echinoides]